MTTTTKKTYTDFGPAQTLRQRETRRRSLSEDSGDITAILNEEDIFTYVSPSITSILGYAPEEIVGSYLLALVHPDDLDSMQGVFGEIKQFPGKNARAEFRLRCKDGSWRWFEGSGTNLLDVPGIAAILGSFHDITGRTVAPRSDLSELSEPGHFVQFCETDAFLVDSVSEFIGAGLRAGDVCIVVATGQHRESLEERLIADGLDVAAVRERGQLLSFDAAITLSKFLVNGVPEPGRFTEVIGGIVEQAAKSQHHVRIFGEMVALLWADGNRAAAIRLEDLWNDLGKTHPYSLLCAYPMQGFGGKVQEEEFAEICGQHSQVIPAESYNALDDIDERLRAITLLQQQATSLEVEMVERRLAEEANLRLAAIVESSDDAILGKDLNGIITSWNAAAERMYGYSAQEIVGQPVTILFPPNREEEFMQVMTRIRRGERVEHFETLRVRKDGVILTVSVSISPIKDSKGTIIGASAIARDITQQKLLEAKYKHLFDSNLIGVFVSHFDGLFLDANDAFLDILGYTREDLQAGTLQHDVLTPPEFRHLSQNAVKALRGTVASVQYEKEYVHKSGKRISVMVAVVRIENTETCIGFVLDISERKELDKRKDEFISMASHELKTPVTSLKGFLSLLQRRLAIGEDTQALRYLARMDAQVNKLTKLIGDLLDISKMQTGQLAYREESFELDGLVQETIENIQGTTQTHQLLLEGQAQAELIGDPDRIGQVLINLLNNAIKYSPRADKVLVSVIKGQDHILVSVQDFGIGISEEHQQRIFERFYQITDPEEKTYPGLGIGLYISCEIVRRHGGHLWVESKKGEGSTFHFTLPLSF